LLYRWFVGLPIGDAVWAATSFGENQERLFSEAVMREFFGKVLALGEWKRLISHEHFTADGALIEAWASMKRFVPKDGGGKPPEDGGKNPSVDFKGEKRKNDTHASTTDPKGAALQEERRRQIPALLHGAYMKYALMENRNGLVVDAEVTQASGAVEREAALRMVKRSVCRGSTLGADKAYDIKDLVQSLREQEVTQHVAAKRVGSAINGRTSRRVGYAISLKKRKRVEEIFGWSKTVGGLRKMRFIGLAKVKAQTIFTFACYNLTRMVTLLGWCLSFA
jgi:hypothetical protein